MRLLSILILLSWVTVLIRTVLNLALVRRLKVVDRLAGPLPNVSVIIPARDEERTIERTVRAMLAQTYEQLEVLVVNDRSTDATGEILARIAAEDSRLVVVNGEEPPEGWLGKPWALEQGSRRALGELLLFVDADVIYAPDAVLAAVAHLERSRVSMLSLFPNVELRGFWESLAMPQLAVTAFGFLPLWLSNRTTIPLLGIGGGPGNLVRRDVFDAIGGFAPLKGEVVDDVGFARLVRRHKYRTELVRADRLISLRMYHGLREIVDGFTKNAFAVFKYSFTLFFVSFVVGFAFQGLPYLLAARGDRIALVTLGLIVLSRLVLYVPLRYGVVNALLGHVPMMVIWAWILCRSVWVTGVRRRTVWRGRKYGRR
ncbi:MAG TPA: glycosyltransferase family 2 protein [Thermoanaerobaculia bacterium]|jgi:chlorobactene glucosyltransferase